MSTTDTAKVERWQRFRTHRNAALASPHGWLTLTSFQWLAGAPAAVEHVPGLWSTNGTTAELTAAPGDGLSLVDSGEPVVGTLRTALDDEESLLWVQSGGEDGTQVVVELARRAGNYAIRTRDAASPVFTGFTGVPTYDYNPAWEVTAQFHPYAEPVDVPISTANPLVDGVHRSMGDLVFQLPGNSHEFRLQAAGEDLGALSVTFHDRTNGDTTDGWRKVTTPKPRPHPDGPATVVLDFNRAINYPSAFTPFGTCPMPVPGNTLDIRVEAGERRAEAGAAEGTASS